MTYNHDSLCRRWKLERLPHTHLGKEVMTRMLHARLAPSASTDLHLHRDAFRELYQTLQRSWPGVTFPVFISGLGQRDGNSIHRTSPERRLWRIPSTPTVRGRARTPHPPHRLCPPSRPTGASAIPQGTIPTASHPLPRLCVLARAASTHTHSARATMHHTPSPPTSRCDAHAPAHTKPS